MDGAYSHAIRKGPILQPGTGFVETLYAPEDISPRTPSDAERALAERVLDATPGGRDALTYARVDLLPRPSGEPVVIEYEITEPSLFLEYDDAAAGAPRGGDRPPRRLTAARPGPPAATCRDRA